MKYHISNLQLEIVVHFWWNFQSRIIILWPLATIKKLPGNILLMYWNILL